MQRNRPFGKPLGPTQAARKCSLKPLNYLVAEQASGDGLAARRSSGYGDTRMAELPAKFLAPPRCVQRFGTPLGPTKPIGRARLCH